MKFWIATKGIVYNPHKYMDGERRYFTSRDKAMDWLGRVGMERNVGGHSWLSVENTLEETDIENMELK